MSTTVLQAHRRVGLSRDKLANSTPPIDADDSDASMSPHFNTLRITKPEKAPKIVEYNGIDNSMRTVHATSTECTVEAHAAESGQAKCHDGVPHGNHSIVKPFIEDDDDDSKSNEPSHQPSRMHCADMSDQSYCDPPPEGTPNSNSSLVSRIPPSSSIPHLLSTSFSSQMQNRVELPGGGLEGIQHQMSFLGLDAALPSPGCGREGDVSFSADDGDQGFFKNSVSPGNGVTTVYQHQGMTFGTPSMMQVTQPPGNAYNGLSPGGNFEQSISSMTGALTASSQYMPSYMTPPHALVEPTTISPPYRVGTLNAQNMQLSLERRLSESKIESSNTPTSENKAGLEYLGNTGEIVNSVNPMHIPNRPTSPLESNTTVLTAALPQQQERQPYQSKYRQQKSAVVRPVLYSAINSLERYNAGSFDNKVIMAKAYGKMGNRKAFPGVPSRDRRDGRIGPNSLDSDMGSKTSSVSSNLSTDFDGRRKESIGSIGDGSQSQSTMSGTRELSGLRIMPSDSSDRGSDSAQRTGNEQVVPILQKKSRKKLPRAKSSGHLSESSERNSDQISQSKASSKSSKSRAVTIVDKNSSKKGKPREKTVGVFRPSCDAYTPRMGNRAIKYKAAEERPSVEKMSSTMGTIQRPNFRDALRRVAIILHQHIVKIERRFETGIRGIDDTGLFKSSMREYFSEDNFATPRYKCSIVRVPMARPGVVYSMRKIRVVYNTPTTDEIYEFAHQLFKKVQLSSECSIVCLIYVEKLMEVAKVPLVSNTWKPIFMCGLLLASKVWQDLSSWNIEFASVYPQFSLDAINRLELQFLKSIKWDLYISSRDV
ncbi:hypothetical protein ACHAXS_009791 [Conticribra weissflogii]